MIGRWSSRSRSMRRRLHEITDPSLAVEVHVRRRFAGHAVVERRFGGERTERRLPGFRILEVGPGPFFTGWTYVTVGHWDASGEHGHGNEFVLSSDRSSMSDVELLTMVAVYSAGPASQRLDWGHTAPVGDSWRGGDLDHVLVSTPYAYDPEFTTAVWDGGHAEFLAVLPISAAERDFKVDHGIEALESRFEQEEIAFTDAKRASVI